MRSIYLPAGVIPRQSFVPPNMGLEGFELMTDLTGMSYFEFLAAVSTV